MEISIKTWAVIALLGSAQGIILSILLFTTDKSKNKANRILAVLICLFSLRLGEFTGYWTPFFSNYPHFLFITSSFPFLFGALLYLYVKRISDRSKVFKNIELFHFLPFIIHLISLLPFYLQSSEYKLSVLMNSIFTSDPVLPARYFIVRSAQDILMLVYAWMSLRTLKIQNLNVKGKQIVRQTWLRNLVIGFAVFIFLDVLNLLELLVFKYKFVTEIESILMISSTLLIYVLGYFAIKKPQLLSGELSDKGTTKYEKSGLGDELAESYLKRLIESMEVNKIFTNNELNLSLLSKELNIPQHHISQILNEKLNQSFFDFVNKYRIEEAKRLISCPNHYNYTILAIALESGFNNKVSFNSSFKKLTGLTPSEFRNANKPQYA
jgi:AraC-like DNA-binding protein